MHSSIQSHAQGGAQVPESAYPFTVIHEHLERATTTVGETACKLGHRPDQVSAKWDPNHF